MLSRPAMLILATASVLTIVAAADEREVLRERLLGKVPHELVSEKSHWLGRFPPRTLAELKGKVVWLQFNF